MLDLTGLMIIWDGLFAHGDGFTGLVKVVFCYALPTVVQGLAPTKHFISGQPHFGHNCLWGWGVTVWGCFSFYSKMDLCVLDGNLTCQKYRDNVLAPLFMTNMLSFLRTRLPTILCLYVNHITSNV